MSIRRTLKRSVKQGFLLLALPLYLVYKLATLGGNPDSAFQGASQTLSLIPGKIGTYLRAAFYRLACPDTSDEIVVGFLTVLSHRNTTIRRGVYIGPQCNIGMCDIGEDSLLGSGVHVLSGGKQHGFEDPLVSIQSQPGTFTKIRIGKDCWLGNGSLILAPLADHSVVAAGTVLTKQFSTGDMIAGNPGKVLRNRLESITSGRDG